MKKKILFIFPAVILSAFLLFSASQKVKASSVPYPTPHRSWIKLGLVAYQGTMTPEQIDWTAANIDWFDSPYSVFLPQYKAKTDAPILYYDNYYCLYVGQDKYNSLVSYVAANGLNLEDMFLHFDVATTITFGSETHTLPAGSRVPTYGWYGTGGDLTIAGARVIMNASNPGFRQFNAEYELSLVNKTYEGVTYDGIFVDNSAPGVLFNNNGTISTGGTYAEYPGKTRDEAKNLFDSDMVLTFQSVREAFGPKGSGNKQQVGGSVFDNWNEIFPYVDSVFREFVIQPNNNNATSISMLLSALAGSQSAGIPSIVTAIGLGSTNTDLPREKMTALSEYYLAALPSDYFCRQDKNSGDPETYAWFKALDYDVGLPKAAASIFATGADPSSAKIDSGTGTVTHPNAYVLTDPTKNWTVNEWQNKKLVDSAGNIFGIASNTANTISIWRSVAPFPTSGHYEIGDWIYKIYSREFGNVLVMMRPKSDYNSNELGDPSAVTKDLPQTADNPSGKYYKLNADGTISFNPLTQITLRNAEGVVLIKESTLIKPIISKSVNSRSALTDDVLTYTISYSNYVINYPNARIEDPIPSGSTYIEGSATGGATYDSTSNKIILQIGNLPPGTNGTISFKVRVN